MIPRLKPEAASDLRDPAATTGALPLLGPRGRDRLLGFGCLCWTR
jgi:hypothetical protein